MKTSRILKQALEYKPMEGRDSGLPKDFETDSSA
jgi:hypothetical protein